MSIGEVRTSTEVEGPWSKWGIRLVAVVVTLTVVSLGFFWAEEFYRGIAENTVLSYTALDKPWMPNLVRAVPIYVGLFTKPTFSFVASVGNQPGIANPIAAVPIIGSHYFGDFQLPYAWALNIRDSLSPYLGSAIPANYPPLTLLFLVLFTFIPIKVATVIFLALSLGVFLVPLWLLMSPLDLARRVLMFVPLAVMCTPVISMLDRANDIGIGIGCISWAVYFWRKEFFVWCGVFVTLAIALKGYPIVLLVVPLALRRYRFCLRVVLIAGIANLLAMLVIPGGFLDNLKVVIPAMTSQALTTASQLSSWSLYSLLPKTAGLILGPSHAANFLTASRFWLWLPSVLYLCLVFVIVRLGRIPQWCWATIALASVQLVTPLSGPYTAGWACLGAVWFAVGSLVPETDGRLGEAGEIRDSVWLRTVVLLALATSLVPSVVPLLGAGGFSVVATVYLSPLLLLVTLCLAVWESVKAGRLSEPVAAISAGTMPMS